MVHRGIFLLAAWAVKLAGATRDAVHGVPPVKNIEESIDLLAWHVGRTDHESGFKNKKFVSQAGEEVVFEESGGHWSGPGDHSSAVSFGWAADRLLVVAHVVDDEHVHSGGGGYGFVWDGDALQLLFTDADRSEVVAMYNVALYDDGTVHTQLELIPEDAEDVPAKQQLIKATVLRDEAKKETIYKVEVPLPLLGLPADVKKLKEGIVLGVAVCINDGDRPPSEQGQRGWSGLNPDAIVYEKEPEKAQLLVLDGKYKAKARSKQRKQEQEQKQQGAGARKTEL